MLQGTRKRVLYVNRSFGNQRLAKPTPRNRMFVKRTLVWTWCLIALVLLAGCTEERERVMLPPEAPVSNIRSIAVVGVANYTVDPGIALVFEESVASVLRESGRYQVVDGAAARAALAAIGAQPEQLADPAVAQALGRRLDVDAIITGAATYYFDDTTVSTPECYNCRSDSSRPSWHVRQRTYVYTTFQARVIETKEGAIIWSKTIDGEDTTNRTVYLDWSQKSAPPDSLVPRANRRDIPETRLAAVRDAVKKFTVDLLPRYIWVRKEK